MRGFLPGIPPDVYAAVEIEVKNEKIIARAERVLLSIYDYTNAFAVNSVQQWGNQ